MKAKSNISFCIITLILLQLLFLTSCTKDNSRVLPETIKDIEGNSYKTITIGTQLWLAENLKTTKYNDGSEIPDFYYYNNDSVSNRKIYGALYSLTSVKKGNLCPVGWHVSTMKNWEVLSEYVGGDSIAGAKLKEAGIAHWNLPNAEATNESGFTALPGGWYFLSPEFSMCCGEYYDPTFGGLGKQGVWWADTLVYRLDNSEIILYHGGVPGGSYASVRCIRNPN